MSWFAALPAIADLISTVVGMSQQAKAQKLAAAAKASLEARMQPAMNQAQQWGQQGTQMLGQYQKQYGDQMGQIQQQMAASNLSPQQAQQMAVGQIGGQYDTQMTDQLNALRNQLLSRGMYGQAAGDTIQMRTAADVMGQKQQAISSLANQLYSQGQDRSQQYMGMLNSLTNNYGNMGMNMGQQANAFNLGYGNMMNGMNDSQTSTAMTGAQNTMAAGNQLFANMNDAYGLGAYVGLGASPPRLPRAGSTVAGTIPGATTPSQVGYRLPSQTTRTYQNVPLSW